MNNWTEPRTGMEFVRIPAGKFNMGNPLADAGEDESPVHAVDLDGFWLGRYPVTQAEWSHIMGSNPSSSKAGNYYPMENVSWNDIQEFIEKLNADDAAIFRLPTEAEWEYAARSGGKQEKYAGGNDVDRVAWYVGNSSGHTHPVGGKAPNSFGLHDMCGNVMEWCEDWYKEDFYTSFPVENPLCTDDHTGMRVMRGGSWNYCDGGVRCEVRGRSAPGQRFNDVGFRLACLLPNRPQP